jgi:hypothetical protein
MSAAIFRPNGVKVELPETLMLGKSVPALLGSQRKGRRSAQVTGETYELLEALREQGLQLVDAIAVAPVHPQTPASGKRAPAATPIPPENAIAMTVDLTPVHDAVVLLEQDGVYSWRYPRARTGTIAVARRGAVAMAPDQQVTFEFAIHGNSPEATTASAKRGPLTEFIYDSMRAYIFKFVTPYIGRKAVKLIEGSDKRAIVIMDGDDASKWKRVANLQASGLLKNRPARVLLFVHGAFSSTVGSYGGLCSSSSGCDFLALAKQNYDLVIGYDHPTLSEDPRANAVGLLDALRGIGRAKLEVDVVAFSRGGLVYRSLVEHLLPKEKWQPKFGRVVFVGVPNAGTRLADAVNWERLADLYTNLTVTACKVSSLSPHAALPALILKEIIKTVSAFVKYLARYATADGGVPGLAAMQPDGPFIKRLQKKAGQAHNYVVSSEFQPKLVGKHEPKELPFRFLLSLGEGFMSQLMQGEPNDLVVNTSSMDAIGALTDAYRFERTPRVFHTNYFLQPEVTQSLANWLNLASSQR